jgi:hypothetical protein
MTKLNIRTAIKHAFYGFNYSSQKMTNYNNLYDWLTLIVVQIVKDCGGKIDD